MADVATTTIDFGSTPVDGATFVITDAAVSSTSYVEAYVQHGDSTATNSIDEHEQAAASFRCSCKPGSGVFDLAIHLIFGLATGEFKLRYVREPS